MKALKRLLVPGGPAGLGIAAAEVDFMAAETKIHNMTNNSNSTNILFSITI